MAPGNFSDKSQLCGGDMKPADILGLANDIIHGQRNDDYGKAEDCFSVIAHMWTAYLGYPVQPKDVALMMVLLKVARATNKVTDDTLIDICGYAALTAKTLD